MKRGRWCCGAADQRRAVTWQQGNYSISFKRSVNRPLTSETLKGPCVCVVCVSVCVWCGVFECVCVVCLCVCVCVCVWVCLNVCLCVCVCVCVRSVNTVTLSGVCGGVEQREGR